jgi:hypothetical protein
VETTVMPRVIIAPLPEHPIARCLAGPALLAHVLVSRFADHLPYNRLAKRFAREGVELADSTMCGWVEPCAKLLGRVTDAMLADAIATSPWIGIDPTGVLVQQKEKCRRGYFWVMVAARDHVFFRYTPKQNGDVPKRLLREYKGYVQADAASVYNALFELDDKIEVGCWAHARRRFFDARKSDEVRALTAIGFIHQLYAIDDETKEDEPRGANEGAGGAGWAGADGVQGVARQGGRPDAATESDRRGDRLHAEPVGGADALRGRRSAAVGQQPLRVGAAEHRRRSEVCAAPRYAERLVAAATCAAEALQRWRIFTALRGRRAGRRSA